MQAREDILCLPHSQNQTLVEVDCALEAATTLWRIAGTLNVQVPEIMEGPFNEIDADAVASNVQE